MRAAWKSIECGIGALFTTLMRTRSPSRTRRIGPGTLPPNVHPSYFTPLAISTVSWGIGRERHDEFLDAWIGNRGDPGVVRGIGCGDRLSEIDAHHRRFTPSSGQA